MLWAACFALVVLWFILLTGNLFFGGAVHLVLLAAIGLAAWRTLASPRSG